MIRDRPKTAHRPAVKTRTESLPTWPLLTQPGEKTELLRGIYQQRKMILKKSIPALLTCIWGLVIVMVVGGSILALDGSQGMALTGAPSHFTPIRQQSTTVRPTPPLASTSAPARISRPQAQPVPSFPATLPAEIATLKAHNRLFFNGNPALPEVALTFDDGPNPVYTPQVLAILKKYHVKATFFDIGRLVKAYPELTREEVTDGHIVGNHSWTHPDLSTLTPNAIKAQLQQTSDKIEQVTGVRPTFMRPPYGNISPRVLTVINDLALTIVFWSDEARDWTLPGSSLIVARVLNLDSNGAIILLHDGGGNRMQTVMALPSIIEQLHARGYTFVTMDQIVAHMHK